MKTLRLFGAVSICGLAIGALTACGNDNEDGPSYPVVNVEGSRISAINDFRISYDERGRVDMVVNRESGEQLTIDYKKDRMVLTGTDSKENLTLKFSYNYKGYIKEISSSWDYYDSDDNEHEKGSGLCQYSYDDKGHLIYVLAVASGTETDMTTGAINTQREDLAYHIDWSAGVLTGVTAEGTETENGVARDVKTVSQIEYGREENKSLQMPMTLAEIIMPEMIMDDDFMEILAAVGLFGTGPVQLPASVSEFTGNIPSDSFSISYILNSNGTISHERVNGEDDYSYSYTK